MNALQGMESYWKELIQVSTYNALVSYEKYRTLSMYVRRFTRSLFEKCIF